jgi:hypothetical protein
MILLAMQGVFLPATCVWRGKEKVEHSLLFIAPSDKFSSIKVSQ